MAKKTRQAAVGSPSAAASAWALVQKTGSPAWREQVSTWWKGVAGGEVLLHRGDLELDELVVGPRPLVVAGNLRVRGMLEDGEGADQTLLVVLGNFEAEHVETVSAIFVAGDARVRGALYGDSGGDEVFCVGGDLTARAVIEDRHHVEVLGSFRVEVLVGEHLTGAGQPGRRLAPHDALVKGAFTVEERDEGEIVESSVNGKKLDALLRAGKPYLSELSANNRRLGPADKAVALLKERAARGEKATKLSLAQKSLEAVPDGVFELAWLETLVLDFNDIHQLPPRLGQLGKLRRLSLEGLPLKALPASLGQLSELRSLSLRYCDKLERLPSELEGLVSLEELYLDATAFPVLPEVLTRLPKLKKLWWWRVWGSAPDATKGLIDGIGRLPHLTHSGFLQGKLGALPADLSPLGRLRQFKLAVDDLPEPEVARLAEVLPGARLHRGY